MDNKRNDAVLFDLLRQIIKAEGFSGDPQITVRSGTEIGDGFLSNNSAVEIQSETKTLKLFVKAATKNEAVRSQIKSENLFGREIYFYETVYPAFLKFQMERNVNQPFDSVPKCYLTSVEDLNGVLIFENLKERGYALYNRKVEMNDQVVTSAFKLYARFHAVSYAMKDQEPSQYAKLTENMEDITWTFFKTAGIDVAFAHYCEEVKTFFDPVDDPRISNRIENLGETLMTMVSNLSKSIDDYSAITHGDSWCNNFLFKYKNDQRDLEDVKILDWQVMRVNAPVLDLSYFFYAIATKTDMDKLDLYLKTYHDRLSRNITEMGSDPGKLYPYQVFREHWKKFSKFGLLMSFAIQKAILMDKSEMPDTTGTVDSGKNFGDAFVFPVIRKEDLYKKRIRDIVRHFVDNDFI